ncbi:MAG TPA: cytochrome c maturation protein CcmE [Gammaproteobacteria bacterium]|nr:cytochrome c maturation protein CcmE [Gammaproteobacteria bacterium]
MSPRRRRMVLVGLVLAGVSLAAAFALRAFQENLLYFYSPSQVAAGEPPAGRQFRLGGMVQDGSVERAPGSLEVRFVLTDFERDIPVRYTGVLPDLFREGQGVVTRGRLRGDGEFIAEEVFAKHDENYMPPEVGQSLRRESASD